MDQQAHVIAEKETRLSSDFKRFLYVMIALCLGLVTYVLPVAINYGDKFWWTGTAEVPKASRPALLSAGWNCCLRMVFSENR